MGESGFYDAVTFSLSYQNILTCHKLLNAQIYPLINFTGYLAESMLYIIYNPIKQQQNSRTVENCTAF